MLQRSFAALQKTVLIPTQAGGTQWVAHMMRAKEHLFSGYKGIATHVSEDDMENEPYKYVFCMRDGYNMKTLKKSAMLGDNADIVYTNDRPRKIDTALILVYGIS